MGRSRGVVLTTRQEITAIQRRERTVLRRESYCDVWCHTENMHVDVATCESRTTRQHEEEEG